MSFYNDTFTGASGTPLTSHTSDSGATYSAAPDASSGNILLDGAGFIYSGTGNLVGNVLASVAPGSADIEVSVPVKLGASVGSGNSVAGVMLRASSSSQTYYGLQIVDTAGTFTWILAKKVAGTTTVLNTGSITAPTISASNLLKLAIVGTTLQASFAGSVLTTLTDSSISAAGQVGLSIFYDQSGSGGGLKLGSAESTINPTLVSTATLAANISTASANTPVLVTVTGTGTSWTTATTFAATGGSVDGNGNGGPQVSVPVSFNAGTQTATFWLYPGAFSGAIAITDNTDSASVSIAIGMSAGTITLNYFDQATVSVTATNPPNGTAPYTRQWYRSSLNNDLPANGTSTLVTGATGLTLVDTPGAPVTGTGGIWYYYCTTADSAGHTARTLDISTPLADFARLSLLAIGTSIVYLPGTTDPACPIAVCARALERMNGIRWVDWSNCGISGSSAYDWDPISPSASRIGGQTYYNWMATTQLPAFEAAIGRQVDNFLVMHETNDIGQLRTTSQYQTNMQNIITALHALRPSARIFISYAPADFASTYQGAPQQVNNLLPQYEAITDALIAANSGFCFAASKNLFRYSSFNPQQRNLTLTPQPANQIHYGPQGTEAIGTAWAEGFRPVLFPATSSSIFTPSIFLKG